MKTRRQCDANFARQLSVQASPVLTQVTGWLRKRKLTVPKQYGSMADSLNRAKQSTAANFKAHCSTEKGQSEIRAFLDGVLSLQHPFDEDRREWCFWLVAGGKNPKEFVSSLKSYETPTMCGLVWNKNFVAYRCRDCGISPCMSICADCFHAGNHEGHDFNMFRSQAGGACDCGDENVMKRDG